MGLSGRTTPSPGYEPAACSAKTEELPYNNRKRTLFAIYLSLSETRALHARAHTHVRARVGLFLVDSRTGGFAVKLMKFKLLQDPSLARTLSKTPGGALAMCSHGQMLLKKLRK